MIIKLKIDSERYICICKLHKGYSIEENQQCTSSFLSKQASLSERSTTVEQKKSFQPQFSSNFFLEVSAVRHSPNLQSWVMSGKTNNGTLRKWQKPYPNFEPNLALPKFFSRVLPRQCFMLSFNPIYRKTNEPNLKK